MSDPSHASGLRVKVGLSGQYLVVDDDLADGWIKTDTVVSLPLDGDLDQSEF